MRALAVAALASLAARGCAAAPVMLAGDVLGGSAAVEIPGAPLWRLDRVFQRTCVEITCSASKQKYEAFEGHDREDVLARVALSSLRGHRGGFCISPFGSTYLALRPEAGALWSRRFAAAPEPGEFCEARVDARFSRPLAALALAGALLFLHARRLSHSALFRVSCGGSAVSALALAAVLLYLTRPLWRRNTRLLVAFSGASVSLLWRIWARAFALESWRTMATSPYVLAYVAVTFAAGAAATHILDVPGGPHRQRVTGAFEALLRAVGLVAICVGVQDWRVGAATAAALCGGEATQRTAVALKPLLRWLRARRAARGGGEATPLVMQAEAEAPREGRTPRADVPIFPGGADLATPRTDPDCALVRRGMALNPSTDKLIKIGGAVYNKLVATEGYALNRSTGEMECSGAASAPPARRSAAEATTPGSAVAPRRLERAMEAGSPDAAGDAGGSARRGGQRFASQRAASPARKPRAEVAGRSPPPAARRRSGRTQGLSSS